MYGYAIYTDCIDEKSGRNILNLVTIIAMTNLQLFYNRWYDWSSSYFLSRVLIGCFVIMDRCKFKTSRSIFGLLYFNAPLSYCQTWEQCYRQNVWCWWKCGTINRQNSVERKDKGVYNSRFYRNIFIKFISLKVNFQNFLKGMDRTIRLHNL